MLSFPLLDQGNPNKKFIELSNQSPLGDDKGKYNPCDNLDLDLASLHVIHLSHTLCTSCLIIGQ